MQDRCSLSPACHSGHRCVWRGTNGDSATRVAIARRVLYRGPGPGSHAAMLLAGVGANVLRVTRPGAARRWAHNPALDRGRAGEVALDLKSLAGCDRRLELVGQADVLIEGSVQRSWNEWDWGQPNVLPARRDSFTGAWNDRRASNLLDGSAYFYTCYRCRDNVLSRLARSNGSSASVCCSGPASRGTTTVSSRRRTTIPGSVPKSQRASRNAIATSVRRCSKAATLACRRYCRSRRPRPIRRFVPWGRCSASTE
ncbi:MAG: hypothetical protein EPN69_00060 [Rhodanobacter sp.]|nr:MAG: hypothetical protein EPN71_07510 [Rhodanobacter sp.]TAL99576.1 MAG: hypothetical protein EPN69_00060 [Rhodanobacter sp.]TAM41420.1 MAG: hypothetical protein EPN58_06470 [Rhodanobacter sp.]TAN29338.1 MAG: hypothetical protein EPN32_00145 [Rhodanobacter sp.]